MDIRKAMYIGKSSLGFVNGEIYEIKTRKREIQVLPLGETVSHVYVYDTNSTAWYPYKDEEEMMKNWRFV